MTWVTWNIVNDVLAVGGLCVLIALYRALMRRSLAARRDALAARASQEPRAEPRRGLSLRGGGREPAASRSAALRPDVGGATGPQLLREPRRRVGSGRRVW